MKRRASRFGVVGAMALLCLLMSGLSAPALAQKGGSGGGGGGGNGRNSGGVLSSTQTFDDWGIYYRGMLPHGQVSFSYSADGTYKTMSVQLTNINAPDGTVMSVETVEQWLTATGNAFTITYYPITIYQNKGQLSLSTLNGDSVMFLTPFAGQTNVYVWATPQTPLMGVQLGHLGG